MDFRCLLRRCLKVLAAVVMSSLAVGYFLNALPDTPSVYEISLQNVKKDSETSTLTPTTSSTDPIPEATSLRTESRLKSKGKKPKMRCMGPVDGLGYVPSTGLFNQLISFLGLVIYARQQKQGIDQSTLRLFSSWNGLENDVAFEDVLNVSVWNAMVKKHKDLGFPLISDLCKTTDELLPRKLFQKGYELYLNRTNPLLCPFWGGIQPVDAVLAAARAVTPQGLFGVLHARIEDDLRAPGIPKAFWESRTSLPRLYDLLRNSSDECLGEPQALYMCVMAQDVSEEEDRAILDQRKAPWPGAQLVLGGSMSLNGSRLLGALVDFSVAKSAPFFLGSARMSTFTRSIMTIRSCLELGCNLDYEPSSITRAAY